jgi:hypothetical protein
MNIALVWSLTYNTTKYYLERSLNGINGWVTITVTDHPTVTYADTAIVANQYYYYRVRGWNANGFSGYSNIKRALVPILDSVLPSEIPNGIWILGDGASFGEVYKITATIPAFGYKHSNWLDRRKIIYLYRRRKHVDSQRIITHRCVSSTVVY